MSAPITESHLQLTRAITGHSDSFKYYAQLIADSEARAVAQWSGGLAQSLPDLYEAAKAERDQLRAEVERLKHGTVAQFKDAFIDELTREVSLLIARAERAEAELAKERARLDDLVADLNDACITLASATCDCDDYALLNTRFKLTAVRDVLIQYIPPAATKEGAP